MNWNEFVEKIKTFFQDNIWNIVRFAATFVIGFILIQVIMSTLKAIFKKKGMDPVASKFVRAIIRFLLWLVFVLILLSELGIPLTGVTAGLSAAILAIGMALRDFLSNVASGIILIGSRKYKMGDYIVIGDIEGCIVDVNFLFTTLKTYNNTQITLPNSKMVNDTVTNLGAYPTRRVALNFSVAYESDTKLVSKVVVDVMKSSGLVLLDPAPSCKLKEYGSSSLNFFATCYCDNGDYWDVYYYIMEHVYDEFKRNGISVPYQQIEMRERTEKVVAPVAYEKLPERIEKKRVAVKKKMTIEDWEDMGLAEIVKSEQKRQAVQKRKAARAKKAREARAKKKEAKQTSEEKNNG